MKNEQDPRNISVLNQARISQLIVNTKANSVLTSFILQSSLGY